MEENPSIDQQFKCKIRLKDPRIILQYNAITCFVIILLLFSCNVDRQSASDEMPPLYLAPQSFPLNLDEGYIINPLTGDSIQAIINSQGDTIKTGIPIQVTGKAIDPGIVVRAEAIPAGKPVIIPTNLNVHQIPNNLTVVPVNKDSLITFTTGIDSSAFVLLNSRGDSVPTGVPLSIKGEVVPCIQHQPVKALNPSMMDNSNIHMTYLDFEHGMNGHDVMSILEDRQGNIWFGTSLGVSRYNGESFVHFTESEGLSHNFVWSIMEDSQGNIWIGSERGGISKYDGEYFTHYTESEGFSNNDVRSILEDMQGNLWFGTVGGGVSMYNGKTFTHYTIKEGLSNNYISCIMEDSQGNLWFGTDGGGVCKYNGETFSHYTIKEGLSNNSVLSILEDSQGNLWFGTDGGGVCKSNGETFTHYTTKEGLSNNRVRSILEDKQGNLWLGTYGGVSKYDGETFTHYTVKEGLSNNRVQAIMEDSYGNLWFGTAGAGANMLTMRSFKYLTNFNSSGDNLISAILEDSHGNIWFGPVGGGVSKYNGNTITHYSNNEGFNMSIGRSILEDSHGNFWLGRNDGGVSMYNGKSFRHFTEKEGFRNNMVRSILEDSHGDLWFGSRGMIKYKGETFIHFSENEKLFNIGVWSILEDSHGNLWFGTFGGGVIKYNGESFMHLTEKEGLCNNIVFSIMEDSQGKLWFGTRKGVSVFNGETFMHFTEKEGLSYNSVMSIVEDNHNNIWLSTDRGLNLFVFDRDSAKDTYYNPEIFTYDLQNGLNSTDFAANSGLLDRKNRIWWSSIIGLTMLDLNDFKIPDEAPSNMNINWIEINEHFADFRQLEDPTSLKMEFDSVAKFYNYPVNLKIPYRLNHLSFHYSAIDWSAPHKLMYSFKMEGLGDQWSLPSGETSVDYRNLPHGTFTFQVRAIGAAQKWSDPFEYTFTIRPPWWFSWWAYLFYGFIAVLIILQYRAYLMNRAKLQTAVVIERMEKEKVEELDHLKSRFFANISHEFRTPLTLLLGPIEDKLKSQQDLDQKELRIFKIMQRNAKRLQLLINQLLDLSKLESGKVRPKLSEGDISGFSRSIAQSFLSLAESRNINYRVEIPKHFIQAHFDPDIVEKILTNLISNAFKFTPENGSVTVAMHVTNDGSGNTSTGIEYNIKDSGKGIPAEQAEKIFERFYQVSSSDSREYEGTGIGLALCRELAEMHHGNISVKSAPGKGATFTVSLPCSRDQFGEDELTPGQHVIPVFEDFPPEEGSIDATENILREDSSPDVEDPVLLIVEDNADLRHYIASNLKDRYQIYEANNGLEGLKRAIEIIPDLVITDLMMPEMDGKEMCDKVKSDERTSHIPVIMVTAKADRESKIEGLEMGADDYLVKPFDSDELQIRVRNMIEQQKRLREKIYKEFVFGDGYSEVKSADEHFLLKTIEHIRKHISDPGFNVRNLSGIMRISEMQLHRKLKAASNMSTGELIRNTRLKSSLVLLKQGSDNISQIAYQVGFSDHSYFSKCFRELYGKTPKEYAEGMLDIL